MIHTSDDSHSQDNYLAGLLQVSCSISEHIKGLRTSIVWMKKEVLRNKKISTMNQVVLDAYPN